MDSGLLTGVVFLDLRKAFDTVDHNILLNKLNTFNFSPECIDWFKPYLGRESKGRQYLLSTCHPGSIILEYALNVRSITRH